MYQRSLCCFVISVLLFTTILAQIDSLPPLALLELSLQDHIQQECEAKLLAQHNLKRSKWKELLPSLGIAYTPTGSPRPSASWSPLQILDRQDANKKREYERSSIILGHDMIYQDRLYKLRQMYQDYQINLKNMDHKQMTLTIDEELFAITEKKYQENIIKPSEYLKEKRNILKHRIDLQLEIMELQKQLNQILYEAKWKVELYSRSLSSK